MKINIINIKQETNKLNTLISQYEESSLKMYNELITSSNYWQDDKSKLFFEQINIEKLQTTQLIEELYSIKEIYETIITKYEELGNKIEITLENKSTILESFNNYLTNLENTIALYNQLELEQTPEIISQITEQIEKLTKIKNQTIIIKETIKNKYNSIENIEKEINFKISKLKIEYIKEPEINKFI